MNYSVVLMSILAIFAIGGLSIAQTDSTGQYIRTIVRDLGESCDAADYCGPGNICLSGKCTRNTGQVEVLPGKLCIPNTPCKYGYECIDGRCQRP